MASSGGAVPSRTIRTLSLITAGYLGVALVFAVESAVLRHSGMSLLVAAPAFVILALLARRRGRRSIGLVLAAGFSAQLFWGAVIEPQPFGEMGTLWEQARLLAAQLDVDILYKVASPGAVGLYAILIFLFGDSFEVLRAVVAALWTVQVWLVWRIANEIAELRRHALAAAAALGLAPSTIVFASLPSAEAVFGLFVSAAVYVILSHRRRGLLESAALAGVLVALAFLARPIALAYLVGVMGILVFAAAMSTALRPRIRLIGATVTCVAGFAAAVAPQALLNFHNEGRFSIAPAPSLGYQLLLGTNRESGGGFSSKDLERAGFVGPNQTTLEEADRNARRIALDRIAEDPLGFAGFAATDKMRGLWGGEIEMLFWSLNSSPRRESYDEIGLRRWGGIVVDGAYLAVLAAAFLGAFRLLRRRGAVRDPIRWLLIYLTVLTLALAYVFLEVRERYHLAFMPMLALLAAYGAGARVRRRKVAAPSPRALPRPAPAQLPEIPPVIEDAVLVDGDADARPPKPEEIAAAAANMSPRRKSELLRGTVARLAEKRAEARAAANASRGAAAELIRQALERNEQEDGEGDGAPRKVSGADVIAAAAGRLPIAPQKSDRKPKKAEAEEADAAEPEIAPPDPEPAPTPDAPSDAPAEQTEPPADDAEATPGASNETVEESPKPDADETPKRDS